MRPRLRARWAAGVSVLLAAVTRCLPQPPSQPTSAAETRVADASKSPPTAEGATHDARGAPAGARTIHPVVSAALARVRAARGLAPRAAVDMRWVTRTDLLAHVRSQLLEGDAVHVAAGLEALLFGLNIVSEDFEFVHAVGEFLGDGVAGLYDPQSKTLLIATDLSQEQTESAIEHELVHALQDQNFAIDDRLVPAPDASDRASALQSLAEGDATCVTFGEACGPVDARLPLGETVPDTAPLKLKGTGGAAVLRRSAMAPYTDGVRLVRWLLARGGWELVNAVWAQPPETSEQVLHPDKLQAREPAEAVPVPVAPDPSFASLRHRDVLGEQSLRVLLAEWLPEPEAADRAAGWGGDRLAVYQTGERFAVGWHIRYDTVAAATRGFEALCRAGSRGEPEGNGVSSEQRRGTGRLPSSTGPSYCRERARRGPLALVRDARDIAVTVGPFRRNARQAQADGDCDSALGWARTVVGQK